MLWRLSSLQRVTHCGRVTRSAGSGPTVRMRDGVAGYAGLQHCGSVWACPVCSSLILVQRALEIGAVLGQAVAEGHALGFGTFTMRHRQGQALAALWGAAGQAWSRATGGEAWVAVQGDRGVAGWVRVWEVTDGRNGWHVHVHFVVVLAPGSTSADLDEVCAPMFGRWARGLVAAGQEAPRLVGQDWHLATGPGAAGRLAEYRAKIVDQGGAVVDQAGEDLERARSLGLELAHTRPGRARADLATRPVWSILDDLALTGEADRLDRWREWEAGSKGRRQVGWSKGLRARFAPNLVDVDDQAVVDREVGTEADDLVAISVEGWAYLVARPALLPGLLDAAEAGGLKGLRQALDNEGVGYAVVIR